MAEHLYICDPVDQLIPGADTTLALARSSRLLGHRSNWCLMRELEWRGDALFARIRSFDEAQTLNEGTWRPIASQSLVFVRTDPPVDAAYMAGLWLLDAAAQQGVRVVNSPSSLTWANEKTLILRFPELIPETMVSGDPDHLRAFVTRHQRAVIKPLDGNGGRGVLVLDAEDRNLNSLIEMSCAAEVALMIQAYLPEVADGDRRVLLIDGEPLGVLNRVAGPDDHRCNMHVGAQAEWVPVSESDRRVCSALAPFLREHGLYFVGIDLIGGRLTEINVTSPTGVEEILAAGGPDLALQTIAALSAVTNA